MTELRKIGDNVLAFLDKASQMRGQMAATRFHDEMFSNLQDVGIESPIEDLFWIAAQLICEAQYVPVNPDPEFNADGETVPGWGIFVQPQAKVGTYRVDFLVSGRTMFDEIQPIVVELDGHDFHDQDKHQRSYEKARDRFLVRNGYRVTHFTGSDIVRDPFRCAHEVFEMAGMFVHLDDAAYDPADPLSLR